MNINQESNEPQDVPIGVNTHPTEQPQTLTKSEASSGTIPHEVKTSSGTKGIPTRLGSLIILLVAVITGSGVWWMSFPYEAPEPMDVGVLVMELQSQRNAQQKSEVTRSYYVDITVDPAVKYTLDELVVGEWYRVNGIVFSVVGLDPVEDFEGEALPSCWEDEDIIERKYYVSEMRVGANTPYVMKEYAFPVCNSEYDQPYTYGHDLEITHPNGDVSIIEDFYLGKDWYDNDYREAFVVVDGQGLYLLEASAGPLYASAVYEEERYRVRGVTTDMEEISELENQGNAPDGAGLMLSAEVSIVVEGDRIYLELEGSDWESASDSVVRYEIGQTPQDTPELPDNYEIKDGGVYYEGELIEGADAESFERVGGACYLGLNISEVFFRDKNNVYCGTALIDGADPATFENIGNIEGFEVSIFYSRDKNNVYAGDVVVRNVDAPSFELLGGSYAKDINNVYCNVSSMKNETDELDVLEMAEPETFTFLSKSEERIVDPPNVARDDEYAYFGCTPVSVDIATFEYVGVQPKGALSDSYGKDKDYVYRNGVVVEGANPQYCTADNLAGCEAPQPTE
jgi:hypothetical protein